MKKLVIFDCDGVLVDSEPLANQALVDCLAGLQIVMTLEEALERFKGRKLADCLVDIEKTRNCVLPETFVITLRERMNDYFESRLRPIRGATEAVKSISHIKCVASNGPLEKMKRNLEITGFKPHFGEYIFSAYTIQKWKPEPDLFLHACREMGFEPRHCVVVEDSELGIQAARAGGFKVLALGGGSSADKGVIPFQDMTELPRLIEQVFAGIYPRTQFTTAEKPATPES